MNSFHRGKFTNSHPANSTHEKIKKGHLGATIVIYFFVCGVFLMFFICLCLYRVALDRENNIVWFVENY